MNGSTTSTASTDRSLGSWLGEACLVLAVYCALAWGLLHPMFAEPAREVFDPSARPDGWLTAPVANWAMWVMAWDWHILTSDPLRLFDANIFHPTPLALATSQPLLGQLALFAPVYALTGNMVLGYQLNLLLALGLCGATMFALLRHWGVGRAAAFFGGFVYLFCPVRLASLTHVQILAAQYLPLVLLFFDRTLSGGRVRHGLAFAAVLLLQVLCSEELSYLTLIGLAGYGAGALWKLRARLPLRALVLVLAATGFAAAVAYGVRLPRLQLAAGGLIADSDWLSWARLDSTGWLSNYLVPPFVAQRWPGLVGGGPSLYVGVVPLACAALALRGRRPADGNGAIGWSRAAALGLIAVSYLMALGPRVELAGVPLPSLQSLATWAMPDLSTVVTPARFGLTLMTGLAALAGLGVQALLDRLAARTRQGTALWRWWLPLLLVAATAFEYGLAFATHPTRAVEATAMMRPAYASLADRERGGLLELPAVTCDLFNGDLESLYTAGSAAHWQPLLNGYGSRPPLSRGAIAALAESLPDERATELLGRLAGLRYVLVDLSRLRHSDRRRWSAPPGLRLAGFFGTDLLFEVEARRPADLQPALAKPPQHDATLLGTPLASLPAAGRKARLAAAGSAANPVSTGLDFKMAVRVTNESTHTWPALAWGPHAAQRVSLAYRWEDGDGKIIAGNSAASPLPYDLAPGQSLIATLCVAAPAEAGQPQLVIGLAQAGEWFADTTAALPFNVVPLGF